jgi:sodium-dependent dicarboxylate transporter 2/3/5
MPEHPHMIPARDVIQLDQPMRATHVAAAPRTETWKTLGAFAIGPALFLAATVLMTPPDGVTEIGMRSLGVFLWILAWWILEPIPIAASSFLALVLLVLTRVFTPEAAFAYWANWVNIFLIGAFIIGHAMDVHGLSRRFAYWMVALPVVGNSSWRLMIVLLTGAALLSILTSNAVTAVIFTSVAMGVIRGLRIERNSRYSEALMICIPWATSIGGIAIPSGAATHLYTFGLLSKLDYRVSFLPWLSFGVPMLVVGMLAMFLVVRLVYRPDFEAVQVSSSFAREELAKMGPVTRAELIAAGVATFALVLWMLPDVAPRIGGSVGEWIEKALPWQVAAMLAALLLFAIPVDWRERRFVMSWAEASRGVEWGVLALVAGALAMGGALSSPDVGLGKFLSRGVTGLSHAGGPALLMFGSILLISVITNFMSNFAAMSLVMPIALTFATQPDSGINPVAFILCLGMGASLAFALPAATPINAIAYTSGIVRTSTMFRGGIVLSMLCALVTYLVIYPIANWAYPWPK